PLPCVCSSIIPCPSLPSPPFFPYTTLFRSLAKAFFLFRFPPPNPHQVEIPRHDIGCGVHQDIGAFLPRQPCHHARNRPVDGIRRSEEHTSELQSLTNLVCRLLLEKKRERPS